MINIDKKTLIYIAIVFVLGLLIGLFAGYKLFGGRANVSDLRDTTKQIAADNREINNHQQAASVGIERATKTSEAVARRADNIQAGVNESARLLEENANILRQIRQSNKTTSPE